MLAGRGCRNVGRAADALSVPLRRAGRARILSTEQGRKGRMCRQWYVLKTKPRAEEKVTSVLSGRGIEAYLPQLKRHTRPGVWRREPLFSGYVFVRIDLGLDEWLRTRSAPCVSYAIGSEGCPTPVPDTVVQAIRTRMEACDGELSPSLQQGDRVVIIGGPFRGIEAVFDARLNSNGRNRVLLTILGRMTRVEIGAHDLRLRR